MALPAGCGSRGVTDVAARSDVLSCSTSALSSTSIAVSTSVDFSTGVVLLSDPSSLVSMANSATISKRRPCARLYPGYASPVVKRRSDTDPAPAVGGARGPDQLVAQFAQLRRPGPLVERRGDVFGRAAH